MPANMIDSVGYLLAQVCKSHRALTNDLLSQTNLYAGQEMILCHLWGNDGRSLTELRDEMDIQPATLSKMVQRMEKAGILSKEKDNNDSRISRVFLTAEGKSLEDSVGSIWEEMERQTLANFSVEEKVLFKRLLMQVLENIS